MRKAGRQEAAQLRSGFPDFLIQEMGREVNTVGSKSVESKISHLVVDMKSELEKIREQIQNIE